MNNTWSPQTIEEQARNYVEDLADDLLRGLE